MRLAYPNSIQNEAIEAAMDCVMVVACATADGVVTEAEQKSIDKAHRRLLNILESMELAARRVIYSFRTGKLDSKWHDRLERELAQCGEHRASEQVH